MRICLLSKEYPPDTGWGGIGTYTYEIAHGLVECGHDVEVIALAARNTQLTEPIVSTDAGIKIHRVPWQDFLQDLATIWISIPFSHYVMKTSLSLWSRFIAIHEANPFDVVEAPEHLAEGLLPAVAASAPLVIKLHTPHSKFIAEKFHNITPDFDQQLIALMERIAMLAADVLISPSENLADFVAQDLNYPRQKILSVKNPVDSNSFTPEGPVALPRNGKLTVMFVGRLESRKGVEHLIDAVPDIVRQFPNVQFVIIGTDTVSGKRSMLAQLKTNLAASKCTTAVTFIPRVPLAEMPGYYRSADICIAPSLYDNAPYTCIEAMSCGRPLIGTTAGGMQEYICHGESGLVIPPGDKNAITTAILSLLSDAEKRERFGRKARKYIVSEVGRRQVAEKNVAIYQQAQSRFAQRQGSALYRKGGRAALKDALSLVYAYHRMLYDLLYQKSYVFRIRHWSVLVSSRPRLALAKAAVAVGNSCLRPLGLKSSLIGRLKDEIAQKDREREDQLQRQFGGSGK